MLTQFEQSLGLMVRLFACLGPEQLPAMQTELAHIQELNSELSDSRPNWPTGPLLHLPPQPARCSPPRPRPHRLLRRIRPPSTTGLRIASARSRRNAKRAGSHSLACSWSRRGERIGRGTNARHATHFPFARSSACSSASRYFAAVFSTTSGGKAGGGLVLSQPVVSSQSRTNCLSNDGGDAPGR